MSKRSLVVAGAAALSLILAACGSSDGGGSSTSPSASDTTASSSAATAGKIGVILPDAASSAALGDRDRQYLTEAFTAAGVESTSRTPAVTRPSSPRSATT